MIPLLGLLTTLMLAPPTDWRTPFERDPAGNTTATYTECVDFYRRLAGAYPQEISLRETGQTDGGVPLYAVVVSTGGAASPEAVRRLNRRVVLVQNGIHPGEPEGIDASMMLVRDVVQHKDRRRLLDGLTLAVVPVYNADGMLNRGPHSRVNQLGPAEYGFRGNARNLDLNRDYIKQDSRNARAFAELFQAWRPDVFVETHTSNGSHYQYAMTPIATQAVKLPPALRTYLAQRLLPALYAGMEKRHWPMVPYVDFAGRTPETGLLGFLDLPRYSTGYAALFNTLGMMPETHMLKPFRARVESTYAFLEEVLGFVARDGAALAVARAEADRQVAAQTEFPLTWTLDEKNPTETIAFRGYEARTTPSAVSGLPRLSYDRAAPFTRPVPYFNTYAAGPTVKRPAAYLIPQAWGAVVERLQRNGVTLRRLTRDVTLPVEARYIEEFAITPQPYEGHYLHRAVTLRTVADQPRAFQAGDYVADLNQPAARYLVETLEPQAPDSFFAWGFFDSILQSKEHFSDYVFEDVAAELLQRDPALKQTLEAQRRADPAFAQDGAAQLEFVYRRSPYYEPTH
ncbi:MAG: hypothetical protein H7330_13990, partial [Hymenobacteraceae bacterium]|nr:hypothetical protein [Hymenobacteraceae bacterium]